MKKNKLSLNIVIALTILINSNITHAQLIQGINQIRLNGSYAYETININFRDTVAGSIYFHKGIINNNGLIKESYDPENGTNTILQGNVTLNNNGRAFFEGGITAGGLSIKNNSDGLIVFTDYIDGYQTTNIENAGTIIVADKLGDGTEDWQAAPFTYMIQGLIHNTGTFQITRKSNINGYNNLCVISSRVLTIKNEGYFEIGNNSNCDFGQYAQTNNRKVTYIQTTGETKVNNTFGAHVFDFQGGKLTGTGTILRFPTEIFTPAFTISPGDSNSPFGELTLNTDTSGYIVLGGASLDFTIGGAAKNSKLHVNGDFYIVDGAKINVVLKDGFTPNVGNSFTLINADSVDTNDFNQSNLNLPALSGNRHWQMENTGNSLKITVM